MLPEKIIILICDYLIQIQLHDSIFFFSLKFNPTITQIHFVVGFKFSINLIKKITQNYYYFYTRIYLYATMKTLTY